MQATTERPRFRQDLVAESIDDQGARFIDVMDPDSGNVFRFYEVEYSLACAMDGERDIAGIVQWAREELGVTPSQAEVRTVIATLGELGFIEPGASVAADPEIVPGVIVGNRADTTVNDVELGQAGTTPHDQHEMPAAPSLTLGAPGISSPPARPAPVEDIALGVPGPGDVMSRVTEPTIETVSAPREMSVDLSEQVTIRPDDVKEAVRASKVMQAVEVPKDLMNALESAESAEPTAVAKPRYEEPPSPPRRPTPLPVPVARPAEPARPPEAAKPARQPAKTPLTLPKTPPAEARPELKEPVPTPLPSATSPVLIVVLILVVVGAAAFLVWKYVIDVADDPLPTKPAKAAVEPPKPEPAKPEPAKPVPVKAKLSSEPMPADEIKLADAATIEAIEANDKSVKPGDAIVWLAGHKKIADEITPIAFEVEKRIPGDIAAAEKERDAAKAANNAAAVTAAEKKIDDKKKALDTKQQQLDAKRADADKLVVKAASAGKLAPVAKAGAKLTPNDVVAKINREPAVVATFDLPGSKATVGSTVKVADDKNPEKVYDCTVAEVTADKVKVNCGNDTQLDGLDITFKP